MTSRMTSGISGRSRMIVRQPPPARAALGWAPAFPVVPAVPLAAAFAAAAHLANTLRDFDSDAASGSRCLAQVLGRGTTHWLAVGLALAVGLGVAVALGAGGRASPASLALGAIGLACVGLGALGERWLWYGLLGAAMTWTAAWAISTG